VPQAGRTTADSRDAANLNPKGSVAKRPTPPGRANHGGGNLLPCNTSLTPNKERTMAQTHAEAVQMVIAVMRNGHRLDRHLQIADDRHYYTTPARTYNGQGADARPFVYIPEGYEVGEESEEECAEALIQELGRLVAQAQEQGR
jgi:hypothetical protein